MPKKEKDTYSVKIPGYTVTKRDAETGLMCAHHTVGGVDYDNLSYEMMHAINRIFESTVHALNALGDVHGEEKKNKGKA